MARLHQKEGTGFGLVDNFRLLLFGDPIAPHLTWLDYLKERFTNQSDHLDFVLEEERKTGVYLSKLSPEQRDLMEMMVRDKPWLAKLIDNHRSMLINVRPNILHGNVHRDIIFTKDGKYSGLADFSQMVLGDPIDDLAYASVMPRGEKWRADIEKGWKLDMSDENFDEKMHLYRLLESFRKIYTRYVKHHWLGQYSQPLEIAQQEMKYFSI